MNRNELLQFLKDSRDSLGEFYPVLKTTQGLVIDGAHRIEAGWTREEVCEGIDTFLKYLAARLVTNTRRKITIQEKQALINDLAKELTRLRFDADAEYPISIAAQIAALTGWSDSTVYRYLDAQYVKAVPSYHHEYTQVPEKPPRRNDVEQVADILSAIDQSSLHQLKKTQILLKANLSPVAMEPMLQLLLDKDYLVYDKPYYRVTETGRHVLNLHRCLLVCLRYTHDAYTELPIPLKTAYRTFMELPIPAT